MTRLSTILLLFAGLCVAARSGAAAPWFEKSQQKPSYALVIGVSAYRNVEKLKGPANDVEAMYRLLVDSGKFDEKNIVVLADSLPADAAAKAKAVEPTKKNIMDALEDLVRVVGASAAPNALIYYAGHGAYVPEDHSVSSPDYEADDRDEILLPIDVGKWRADPTYLGVENEIRDDAIKAVLARLSARGAHVWLILDSCFAAGSSRAETPAGARLRRIDPKRDLGVPEHLLPLRAARGPGAKLPIEDPPNADMSNIVEFFAAHADEEALELDLPDDQATGQVDGKPYGLFTYYLVQSLRKRPHASYRDIARSVTDRFQDRIGTLGNTSIPTPEYSIRLRSTVGHMLGESVVGLQAGIALDGVHLSLQIGGLHGAGTNSIVELSERKPSGGTVGYAKITRVFANISWLEPFAQRGKPALTLSEIKSRFGKCEETDSGVMSCLVRLDGKIVEFKPDFSLAVAPPNAADAEGRRIGQLLDRIASADGEAQGIRVVRAASGATPDLKLVIEGEWLLFAPGGLKSEPVRDMVVKRKTSDLTEEKLKNVLSAIARHKNLLRIAREVPSSREPRQGRNVEIEVKRYALSPDQKCGCPEPDCKELRKLPEVRFADGDASNNSIRARRGECLVFIVANHGQAAVDYTPLLAKSDFSIAYPWPGETADCLEQKIINCRLEAGQSRAFPVRVAVSEREGTDHLIIFWVDADASGPSPFNWYVQDGPDEAPGHGNENARDDSADAEAMLSDAFDGHPASRGTAPGSAQASAFIFSYTEEAGQ